MENVYLIEKSYTLAALFDYLIFHNCSQWRHNYNTGNGRVITFMKVISKFQYSITPPFPKPGSTANTYSER